MTVSKRNAINDELEKAKLDTAKANAEKAKAEAKKAKADAENAEKTNWSEHAKTGATAIGAILIAVKIYNELK